MKKIVYLAVVLMFSSVTVNAQEKDKKTEDPNKVEEDKSRLVREISIEDGIIEASPDINYEHTPKVKDPDYIYSMAELEIRPEYPGGDSAFKQEVLENFKIPEIPAEKGRTVRVYTNFVVERDGSISNVKCLRDPGYGVAKEVERAVKATNNKWKPGIQNGKPVRVSYTLPIEIKIPAE